MRFALSDEQELLKRTARDFLSREAPLEKTRSALEEHPAGYPPELYAQLAELGYFDFGPLGSGSDAGMGSIALVTLLHEMGRVVLPGPFLDLAIAAELLHRAPAGTAPDLLERLRSGDAIVVVADAETASGEIQDPPAVRCLEGKLRGTKRFVPFGAHADAVLVATREGIALAERPARGWQATPLHSLDHAQRRCDLSLDQEAQLLATGDAAASALDGARRLGALGAAAQLLGLMEHCFETTLDHLGQRRAFGAPIGSFQALQHRAADLLLRTESARAAVYRAAWALEADPRRAPPLIATAKAYAGDAARFVCGQAIQLHGGTGFTWECDLHVFYKRAQTLSQFYGAQREQLDLVLRQRGL